MSLHEKVKRVIVPVISFLLILGILVNFSDIVCRDVLKRSIPWAQQITVWAVIAVTFLVAGIQVKEGTHISVDFISANLKSTPKRILSVFNSLIVALFSCILLYSTIILLKISHEMNVMRILGTFSVPEWLIYLGCMAIGAVLLAVYSVLCLFTSFKKLKD